MAVVKRQVVDFGMMSKDYMEGINVDRMRKERLARAQAALKKHGAAAAILCGANYRYATGVRTPMVWGPGEAFAVIFADSDDSIVITQYEHVIHNRVRCPWIKPENFRPVPWMVRAVGSALGYQSKRSADMVLQALKERKVEKEKIATDMLHAPMHAALEAAGVKLVPTAEIMYEARRVKTRDEIACMRMAGVIVDKAWWKMFENIRPGIKDCELSAIGAKEIQSQGAEGPFLVSVRTGPITAPNCMGMLTDRMMQIGDMGFADIWGSMYLGYRTCYYRTWKVGLKPTAKEKDWYKKAYDMLMVSSEAIKPGNTTADVAKAYAPASFWGLKTEDEVYGNAMAHAVGLEQHERPFAHRSFSFEHPEEIVEGMVIANETWYGEDFVGGCRIENMGVVTAKGFENIYAVPDEGILVPPNQIRIEV